MSTAEATADWKLPSPRHVGMACLILTETALFTIFVVAYLFYIDKSLVGPFPADVLEFPWLGTIALLGSSGTIFAAEYFFAKGKHKPFVIFWGITIALGCYFLFFTAAEWHHLIFEKNLTISTNLFGSTFYALVGLHASHVIVGLFLLTIIFITGLRGEIPKDHVQHVEIISWYWHFVDAIWVIVLIVVYIISVRAS